MLLNNDQRIAKKAYEKKINHSKYHTYRFH